MRDRRGIVLLAAVMVTAAFPACAASPGAPSPVSKPSKAVLLRTYFLRIGGDAMMGAKHPPLDRFQFGGYLPGGQSGKAQLAALRQRFTLQDLAFQYSDVQEWAEGKDALLQLGFGEQIQVKVANLANPGGTFTADFEITFGAKEVFRRKLPFKPGDCVIFAGRLDPSLPILSVFSVEIREFPEGKTAPYDQFLYRSRQDFQDFAPPIPQQRDQEPYLPGIGDVSMPELIAKQSAIYPDAAKAGKIEGDVIVEVVVDREGNVTKPRVITNPSIFDASALAAAATYRYKPAMKNGKPVAVTMNIIIVYKYTLRPN
ncbi:MAG TPA: energy transducer TonB [Candidatus Polarisedimenticolia bacterium]|nr:energy transducer TonB [Candidatus Polarisedimenticolia bacterium]